MVMEDYTFHYEIQTAHHLVLQIAFKHIDIFTHLYLWY